MREKAPVQPSTAGRRGKHGLTRQRLLEVTLALLQREGLAALTSTRIAREGGIAQPGFYAHFTSVDECVHTALEHGLARVQALATNARKSVPQDASGDHLAIASRERIRSSYAAAIDAMLCEPGLTEIVLRYRRDPGPLGAQIRETTNALRDELVAALWRRARHSGMHPEDYPRVAFWGEELWGLLLVGIEALLDDRFTDKDAIVDQLAIHTYAILGHAG